MDEGGGEPDKASDWNDAPLSDDTYAPSEPRTYALLPITPPKPYDADHGGSYAEDTYAPSSVERRTPRTQVYDPICSPSITSSVLPTYSVMGRIIDHGSDA